MATQVFSETELAQPRTFPDTTSSQELIRYFTLAPPTSTSSSATAVLPIGSVPRCS